MRLKIETKIKELRRLPQSKLDKRSPEMVYVQSEIDKLPPAIMALCTPDIVEKEVCEVFNKVLNTQLCPSYIRNVRRFRETTVPRQYVMMICNHPEIKHLTKMSLAKIGLYYIKDHATVIHASKTIPNLIVWEELHKRIFKRILLRLSKLNAC
jgi:chromosomal replication initiation ATPase DnaA